MIDWRPQILKARFIRPSESSPVSAPSSCAVRSYWALHRDPGHSDRVSLYQDGRSSISKMEISYRLARGKRETNKRQPPVPIPQRSLAHLRRWHANGIAHEHFVEWNGKPVKSVKTAFKSATTHAGLSDVSAHTLRQTAGTWLMQLGVSEWQASGVLGMSPETLRRVYGHHHPRVSRRIRHRA